MSRLRIPFALLILLAFAFNAPAAQETEAKPKQATDVVEYSFLMYYMGSKIGWLKGTHTTEELDGRKVIHEHEQMWLQIKRSFDGMTFESEAETDTWYETNWRTIRSVDVEKNGGQTIRTETAWDDKQIKITETVDKNKPLVSTVELGDKDVYNDVQAWHVLKQSNQLKPGHELKFWSLDSGGHTLNESTWTVSAKVKHKRSDDTVDDGWQIKIVNSGRAGTVIVGEDDLPVMYESAGGYSLERVKEIPDPFKPERVSLRNTMAANVSLQDYKSLTEMQIHFEYEHDDGDGVPVIADTNAYHDVIKYDKGYALRLKSQRLTRDFDAPAYPLEKVPDDVKKYLGATAMCQSDDNDLCKAAEKLAKGKKDSLSVAKAIMRFTDKRLKNGSGSTGSASAKQAYDECTGDCTEHAALFVALARAAGLPARNIGGFVYAYMESTGKGIFGYHAWAEVWLGKWVPVDATVQEMGTSARYVMFEIDEPGETRGGGRSSRCIRHDIRPRIDAYTMADGSAFRIQGAPKWDWSDAMKPYVEPKPDEASKDD
ncbi:MAG: transglutaminase domain-containing protein [Planctomycetes bacterium]|nr:transglutaminase domain-containing protein [Planctomycetota bacterium]